jgi:hypothetical protein
MSCCSLTRRLATGLARCWSAHPAQVLQSPAGHQHQAGKPAWPPAHTDTSRTSPQHRCLLCCHRWLRRQSGCLHSDCMQGMRSPLRTAIQSDSQAAVRHAPCSAQVVSAGPKSRCASAASGTMQLPVCPRTGRATPSASSSATGSSAVVKPGFGQRKLCGRANHMSARTHPYRPPQHCNAP